MSSKIRLGSIWSNHAIGPARVARKPPSRPGRFIASFHSSHVGRDDAADRRSLRLTPLPVAPRRRHCRCASCILPASQWSRISASVRAAWAEALAELEERNQKRGAAKLAAGVGGTLIVGGTAAALLCVVQ